VIRLLVWGSRLRIALMTVPAKTIEVELRYVIAR
jgi:hypothetical protein